MKKILSAVYHMIHPHCFSHFLCKSEHQILDTGPFLCQQMQNETRLIFPILSHQLRDVLVETNRELFAKECQQNAVNLFLREIAVYYFITHCLIN